MFGFSILSSFVVTKQCFLSCICFRLQIQYKTYVYVLNLPCFCVSPDAGGRDSLRNKYIYIYMLSQKKEKLAHEAKPNPSDPSRLQDKNLHTFTADSECG
jgi:hypothetical protein